VNVIRSYPECSPARILAVDDNHALLATWRALLAGENYQVEVAGNGIEALTRMRSFLPDLVLSDLHMPEMSGFELLAVIRKRFPQITSVAVSGELSARQASGVVADLFLEKGSYSPLQLLEFIRDLLKHSPLRSRLPEPETAPVCLPQTATGRYALMCNECLRFFLFAPSDEDLGEASLACCPYCNAELPYLVDAPGQRKLLQPRPAA
jgi:CheY-like chemotaxis protein